jgi:hypothetical protein
MTLSGTIEGNIIRLDHTPSLAPGTRVEIDIRAAVPGLSQEEREARIAQVWASAGIIPATPEEARAVAQEDYYGVE